MSTPPDSNAMRTAVAATLIAASIIAPAIARADCGDPGQDPCTGPVPTVDQVVGILAELTDPNIPAMNKGNIVTPGFSPDEAGTIDNHLHRMDVFGGILPLPFMVTNIQPAPNNFAGADKVIPAQMPAPPLTALLRTYGELSPTWVLWLQVGSSYPYEIALGAVEIAAGVLLFWPRTATLGALLALASMAQVFLLNLTFDVSVKILSFQLLLLTVVLLAPQAKRLANVLILEKPSPPAIQPALFTTRRAAKAATTIQVGLGAWVLVGSLLMSWLDWSHYGGGRPKPDLYGIWTVTDFTLNGTALPPLTTQHDRWQRLIIEDADRLSYQQMDGEIVPALADINAHTITLSDMGAPTTLTIDRTSPDRLRLTGQLHGRPVTMTLRRLNLDRLPLRRNGFHWVQQYPDNPLEQ